LSAEVSLWRRCPIRIRRSARSITAATTIIGKSRGEKHNRVRAETESGANGVDGGEETVLHFVPVFREALW
jgi:hypothetical protein